jgi:predicted nucleic acid-binding protein
MAISVLIDTNVLVYVHDRSEPVKQAQALLILDRLQTTGHGAFSVQSLPEFFNAVTKCIKVPLVVTEDFPSARAIEGVRFIDPFAPDFDLDQW